MQESKQTQTNIDIQCQQADDISKFEREMFREIFKGFFEEQEKEKCKN